MHETTGSRRSYWQHVLNSRKRSKWVQQRGMFTITSLFTSGGATYRALGPRREPQL
jgi:hypothetical protein